MIAPTTDASPMTSITLRSATPTDRESLERLAALDSSSVPTGDLVVAERDGHMIAAVAVADLTAVADPFERTDDAVALLRGHVARRRSARPARQRLGLVPRAA
jgi:ketosteroid isomerase-like protein